jgi:hypothetical protein
MRSFWFLLVFAGCDPSSAAGTDAAGMPDDGPMPERGLFVEWRAKPPVPGPLTEQLTVADARFRLDHFQVTSDAGSTNTTRSRYMLAWSAGGGPSQEAFPDAPAGVYSKISLAMITGRPGDYSYRIDGTWEAPDKSIVTYRIEDRLPLTFGFDCDETLSAGGSATLTIKLDLKDAIEGIDFERLWDEGQTEIQLDDGPELLDFRDRLKRAFKVENNEDED